MIKKMLQRLVSTHFAAADKNGQHCSGNEFQLNLDYPFESKPRYDQNSPNKYLYEIINRKRDSYKSILEEFSIYNENFSEIMVTTPADKVAPGWENGWLPILDSMSLYYFLAKYNPANYIEVGSGNSTKFARQAIKDHNLRTVITSIDPQPRAEIDKICDVVIRENMEKVDLSVFDVLGPDDILFIDNSHRMFMNSDATVTFLDVLPRLKKGVLVEIHDICLPYDYPAEWIERYYSEQYGLACYLLAGGQKIEIVLPNKFIIYDQELSNSLDAVWNTDKLRPVQKNGCSFWIRIAS